MKERIKSKVVLAAAVVTALLAGAASAQVAQSPAVGHTVVPQEQPRLPHQTEIPVSLGEKDMSLYETLLAAAIKAGQDSVHATVSYGELGARHGALSRAADGGLLVALALPPYEWPHGEGIQSVTTFMLHVDAAGKGTIRTREAIYGRDCVDVSACEPVKEEPGVMHAFDEIRIAADVSDFWRRYAAEALKGVSAHDPSVFGPAAAVTKGLGGIGQALATPCARP